MNVWIVNLRDNRESEKKKKCGEKFTRCKSRGILAIGWGNSIPNDCDVNFNYSFEKLCSMTVGDLVWVKNPQNGEQNLCEITDNVISKTTDIMDYEYDIVYYRRCSFYEVESCDLYRNNEPDKRKLVARRTIEQLQDSKVIEQSKNIYLDLLQQMITINNQKLEEESK